MNKKRMFGLLGIILLIVSIGTYFVSKHKLETDRETMQSTTTSTSSDFSTIDSSSTTETSVEEMDKIKEKVNEMTIEEKVGQLFFVRVPEENAVSDIKTYHLGGYVLFGRDVENETKESLQEKIKTFQEVSELPLLIGADEEGGTVSRIS